MLMLCGVGAPVKLAMYYVFWLLCGKVCCGTMAACIVDTCMLMLS